MYRTTTRPHAAAWIAGSQASESDRIPLTHDANTNDVPAFHVHRRETNFLQSVIFLLRNGVLPDASPNALFDDREVRDIGEALANSTHRAH